MCVHDDSFSEPSDSFWVIDALKFLLSKSYFVVIFKLSTQKRKTNYRNNITNISNFVPAIWRKWVKPNSQPAVSWYSTLYNITYELNYHLDYQFYLLTLFLYFFTEISFLYATSRTFDQYKERKIAHLKNYTPSTMLFFFFFLWTHLQLFVESYQLSPII